MYRNFGEYREATESPADFESYCKYMMTLGYCREEAERFAEDFFNETDCNPTDLLD